LKEWKQLILGELRGRMAKYHSEENRVKNDPKLVGEE